MRKRPLQARGPLATYHSQPLPPSLTGTLSLIGTPYTTEARVPSVPQDPHSQLQGAPKQPQEDAPRPLTMPRSSPIRPQKSRFRSICTTKLHASQNLEISTQQPTWLSFHRSSIRNNQLQNKVLFPTVPRVFLLRLKFCSPSRYLRLSLYEACSEFGKTY